LKKFALLSVSDKTNILSLAQNLFQHGYELLATGGTGKLLNENKVACTEISDYTGFPEIFNGRVKTLQPKIFGGILQRRNNAEDTKQAKQNGVLPIDIVCVNLYPFEKVAQNPNATLEELIENIDIGGPSLIRAAAKNHAFVSVLTDPAQYENFLNELSSGEVSKETKRNLAVAAYAHTAKYDTFISNTLEQKFDLAPSALRLNAAKSRVLRYGENPHQQATLFGSFFDYFEIFHGKELSYNNILDITAAVELLEELDENSCVIIKHNNPSGAATAATSLQAYENALRCDPAAAFGGIVAFDKPVNAELAAKLNELFLEVVIAPSFDEEALPILYKKKDRRLLKQTKNISETGMTVKTVPGGFLVQDKDFLSDDFSNLKTVTTLPVTDQQLEDLKFAWAVGKNAKSNTIVLVKDKATIGIGAGQVSRVDAVRVAAMKAKEFNLSTEGAVASSDAFFPFPDNIEELAHLGVKAVIQPGGSVRDDIVIEAANKLGLAMIFTGKRHFKH